MKLKKKRNKLNVCDSCVVFMYWVCARICVAFNSDWLSSSSMLLLWVYFGLYLLLSFVLMSIVIDCAPRPLYLSLFWFTVYVRTIFVNTKTQNFLISFVSFSFRRQIGAYVMPKCIGVRRCNPPHVYTTAFVLLCVCAVSDRNIVISCVGRNNTDGRCETVSKYKSSIFAANSSCGLSHGNYDRMGSSSNRSTFGLNAFLHYTQIQTN